ncbi:hypothetical protein ACEWY4_019991 [Coilia grayii]|uniref:Neural cell adhesion molecule 1-like n=1 Tax=Coilia grayii TaxID=363190 RepID=A0ABD1JBB9_9TELE
MAAVRLLLRFCVLLKYWTLTDATLAIVFSDPADVEVGGEKLLLCKDQDGKEGTITWFHNGEEVEEDNEHLVVRKIDETSSELSIKYATLAQSGSYTCKCEYDLVADKRSVEIFVYGPISFGQTATYHEFLKGSTAIIPCLASGEPAVEVRWYQSSKRLVTDGQPRITILPDMSLQIANVQRDDRGLYTCNATIKGRPVFRVLDISVVIIIPPLVEIRVNKKSVKSGRDATVSIFCATSGEPQPNISWAMPTSFDPERHKFNSDKSELTITSVKPEDRGEYVCTATNKIDEVNATAFLDVTEHPVVILSHAEVQVKPAEMVSVSCNISGYPVPTLKWIKKGSDGMTGLSSSGRIRVKGSNLIFDNVAPSDGGLYSCIANSSSGIQEEDFSLQTYPGKPTQVSVKGGAAAATFSLGLPVVDGGSPITNYILQWRQDAQQEWNETVVEATDPLVATPLLPYNTYSLRLAARNAVGAGEFSESCDVRTLGAPTKPGLGKGGVVGIVMLIFLILLIAVDATCCYANRCGMLMFLAVKLFGQKVPGLKSMEEGDGNGMTIDMKVDGLASPRGSIPKGQAQNGQPTGVQSEVTCDKASLTKFEKEPANGDPTTDA